MVKRFRPVMAGLILPLYFIGCGGALPLLQVLRGPSVSAFVFASVSGFASGQDAARRPGRLVIALDGVPHGVIAELRAEGRFRRFHNPARQISTFPSITNPAMVEILGAADSPGYEDHFYDRTENHLQGGIQGRLSGGSFIRGTWRELFGYHAPALKGALGYVAAPVGAMMLAQLDLLSFKQAFRRSTAGEFIGYIGETDSLAHLGGKQTQKSFLRSLDRAVEDLIAESGGRLEVEMFSDHGNHFTQYRKVELNQPLERAGFVFEKSLQRANGVVLPKYGLIGCGVLFTAPENRHAVAETAAQVPGIDFAAFHEEGQAESVLILSRRGQARITRRQHDYRYEMLQGDPLELNTLLERLRAGGLLDGAGFATGDAWLRVSGEHKYADPLRRIFDGLGAHVRTLADVIVSCEDGWYIGNQFFDTVATVQATHGNMLPGESEGFAMSTRQQLRPVVRGHELTTLFALDRILRLADSASMQTAMRADSYIGDGGHCEFGKRMK
ncbi:MAG: hypothetical protein ACKV2V_02055 [Blastocatellia bacterium]